MKNKFKRLIYFDEYKRINGIDQYLLHSGTSYDNPVMLFLHCSGLPESMLAYTFQKKWEDIFTVVHLDQRGIGKTFTKNPNAIPTAQLILEDIHEVVKYLKEKYKKEKIIIFGHSWGTLLGSMYIRKHPEDVVYYIGTGQVINFTKGFYALYEKLNELLIKNNDEKNINILKELGDNFPEGRSAEQYLIDASKFTKIAQKYGLVENFVTFSYLKQFVMSPIFKLSDISAMIKSEKLQMNLVDVMLKYDIRKESPDYKVPIYYILGENDWQTPYSLAKEYFNEINAPRKKLYTIQNAQHGTMFNQPDLFYEALSDVRKRES